MDSNSTKYPKWVIVENPGTDDENIVAEFFCIKKASHFFGQNYGEEDIAADIMQRLPDGTLTTII